MSGEPGNGLTVMGRPSVCFPPCKALCRLQLSVKHCPRGPCPWGQMSPTHAGLSLQRRGVGGREARVASGWWLGGVSFEGCLELSPVKVLSLVQELF